MPKLDWRELAAIFAGGFLGALARVLLVQVMPVTPGRWPWATFVANIAGTLLLGYFVTRLQERLPVSAYRRPLLGTGLCGALSTYSTFSYETLRLAEDGARFYAAVNVVASVVAGLGAVFVGVSVAQALWA